MSKARKTSKPLAKGDLEDAPEVIGVEEAPTSEAGKSSQPVTPTEAVKGTRTPKTVSFPTEGKINKYGFLFFSKNLRHTLGLPEHEDIPIVFEKDEEGRLIVKAKEKPTKQE